MSVTNQSRLLGSALGVVLAVGVLSPSLTADHRWGKYHWSRSTNPVVLQVGDNVSAAWAGFLAEAVSDWNASDVLSLSQVAGGTDAQACVPTLGRIEVCNAHYGSTGWLGLAQIWISRGSHIAQATTKVNDTYFDLPQYDSDAWRRFVMCQEIGHDFGLDHQDEIFDNPNLGSCMDYTSDPDGSLGSQASNEHPNQHDFAELLTIYSHLDGGGGGGGGGGGRGRGQGAGQSVELPDQALAHVPDHVPAQWGRLIRSNGRVALFDLDLGNDNHIITFVIWA